MASLSARLEAAERAHAGCGRETAELRRRITEHMHAADKLSRQLQELTAQASRVARHTLTSLADLVLERLIMSDQADGRVLFGE